MLNKWHHKAQKETQHGRHSESNTPTHDSSPIHLLHNSNNQSGESFPNPRRPSHSEHHDHRQFYDPESQQQAAESSTHLSTSHEKVKWSLFSEDSASEATLLDRKAGCFASEDTSLTIRVKKPNLNMRGLEKIVTEVSGEESSFLSKTDT
ncbi:hypothetical protein F2Q68_00040645 [Brassica cretica]|uniref:Uncharacterized protein n=1 Tax=Brassica cretica TaxID=69181 RepID=A0A8S9MPJ3_BRACR|nr:hypothetical protein F2Q68_00040645 [Brassica cretica]